MTVHFVSLSGKICILIFVVKKNLTNKEFQKKFWIGTNENTHYSYLLLAFLSIFQISYINRDWILPVQLTLYKERNRFFFYRYNDIYASVACLHLFCSCDNGPHCNNYTLPRWLSNNVKHKSKVSMQIQIFICYLFSTGAQLKAKNNNNTQWRWGWEYELCERENNRRKKKSRASIPPKHYRWMSRKEAEPGCAVREKKTRLNKEWF